VVVDRAVVVKAVEVALAAGEWVGVDKVVAVVVDVPVAVAARVAAAKAVEVKVAAARVAVAVESRAAAVDLVADPVVAAVAERDRAVSNF
jgi:hypothetical protein